VLLFAILRCVRGPTREVCLTGCRNHERLIPAMGHYDLVGFQTRNRRRKFRSLSAEGMRHAEPRSVHIPAADRMVRIGIFPVALMALIVAIGYRSGV